MKYMRLCPCRRVVSRLRLCRYPGTADAKKKRFSNLGNTKTRSHNAKPKNTLSGSLSRPLDLDIIPSDTSSMLKEHQGGKPRLFLNSASPFGMDMRIEGDCEGHRISGAYMISRRVLDTGAGHLDADWVFGRGGGGMTWRVGWIRCR